MELYTITISLLTLATLYHNYRLSHLLHIKNNVIANYDRALQKRHEDLQLMKDITNELTQELEKLKKRT